MMKRAASLLLTVLCSSLLLHAQDQDKAAGMVDMTGQVCRSTCVKTDAGTSTCDASCKDKSGAMVFLDDKGKVWTIKDPKVVKKEMMGKKVKATGKMMDGDTFDIQHIVQANAG